MKILFVGRAASGDEHIDANAAELALRLDARADVQVDLVDLGRPDHPSSLRRTRDLRARGARLSFLGTIDGPPWPLMGRERNVLSVLPRLRRLLIAEDYDYVFTHSSNHVASIAASLVCLSVRTQHVMGVHADLDRTWLRQPVRNALGLACLRMQTRFFAVSRRAARSWTQLTGTPAERTHVIHNAIRDEFFTAVSDRGGLRTELGVPADARLVLFVGRVVADKGVTELVEATGAVLEDRKAHLLMVGDLGERGYVGRLRRALATEPWARRVHFLGFRNDVSRIMASADLLVLPSWTEGFGLVLAEAMACGLPIVASDVGGIPEVLAGSHSVLVPARDPGALRHAIETVLGRTAQETWNAAAIGRTCSQRFTIARRASAMFGWLRARV